MCRTATNNNDHPTVLRGHVSLNPSAPESTASLAHLEQQGEERHGGEEESDEEEEIGIPMNIFHGQNVTPSGFHKRVCVGEMVGLTLIALRGNHRL